MGSGDRLCEGRSRENTACACSENVEWPPAEVGSDIIGWRIWRQELAEDGSPLGPAYEAGWVPRWCMVARPRGGERRQLQDPSWMFWWAPLMGAGRRARIYPQACDGPELDRCGPLGDPWWYREPPVLECWYEADGRALCVMN